MIKRVLITGARSAAALELARSFHAIGWEVHVADCSSSYICRWAKSVSHFHKYPSPVASPIDFQQAIRDIISRIQPDLIVPTCEEVFHLGAPSLESTLGSCGFQPPLSTLRQLHDKSAFAALCEELSLRVPESHVLNCSADFEPFKATAENWVFKKCFSRFGGNTLIGPHKNAMQQITLNVDSPWLAQRRIIGQEASFYAVASEGTITAFSAYTSSWRLKGGASYVFTSAEAWLVSTLKSAADKLATQLNLTGQFAGDAIIDENETVWLIECNPRATSGAHLISGDGQLATAILGDAALETPGNHFATFLLPALSFFGLFSAIRQRKLKKWWQTIRVGRDVIGRHGDQLPLLGATVDSALFAISALRKGITTTAATTCDIEWNGGHLQ